MAKDNDAITLKVLVDSLGPGPSMLGNLFSKVGDVPVSTKGLGEEQLASRHALAIGAEASLLKNYRKNIKEARNLGVTAPGVADFAEEITAIKLGMSGKVISAVGQGSTGKSIRMFNASSSHKDNLGSKTATPSVTDGATSLLPPGGVKDSGGAPSIINGTVFGYNREGQYTIFDPSPEHLSMSSKAIENQKRITRDIAARNRSSAGGEQLGLFNSGTPSVSRSTKDYRAAPSLGTLGKKDISGVKQDMSTFAWLDHVYGRHGVDIVGHPKNHADNLLYSKGSKYGNDGFLRPVAQRSGAILQPEGVGVFYHKKSESYREGIWNEKLGAWVDPHNGYKILQQGSGVKKSSSYSPSVDVTPALLSVKNSGSVLSTLMSLLKSKPANGTPISILGAMLQQLGNGGFISRIGSSTGLEGSSDSVKVPERLLHSKRYVSEVAPSEKATGDTRVLTKPTSVIAGARETREGSGALPGRGRRGNFLRQGAEQIRHAAWWSLYTAPLAGAVALGAKTFGGDTYAESAAHDLIGVGMHSYEDRARVLEYGRRQSEKTPYTRPQDFINSYKETTSGLGVDPTPENIPDLLRTSKTLHTYSKYSMQNVSTAARSVARQTTQAKAVASEFKGMSNTQTADYISNVLASIYSKSAAKGDDMDAAFRYGGSALMGEQGWGWSYSQTASFLAQSIQSGMSGSQIGVTAKHMATGVPFYQQAAKIELIKRQIRQNAAKPGVGWTRDAIPYNMFKPRYWTKHKAELMHEASKQAKIFRSGPEAALSQLHEHASVAAKLANMGVDMRGLETEQMIPLFQLFAQQSKQDAVGNVKQMEDDAKKAAERQELKRAEKAKEYDPSLSASWSKIFNWVGNSASEYGQSIFGRAVGRVASRVHITPALEAVRSGDRAEAASRYIQFTSAQDNSSVRVVRDLREGMVYTEITNQLKSKGASQYNKLSVKDLPGPLQEYLDKNYLVGNSHYPELKKLLHDIPKLDSNEWLSSSRTLGKKFKLPAEGIGGLPGQQDILNELKLIPEKIAKKIIENSPDLTVNVSGVDANVGVEHSNKPVTGIPAAPANSAPAGYFKWGSEGKLSYASPQKSVPAPHVASKVVDRVKGYGNWNE